MSLNLYASQQMMNKDMKKKFTKTFDLSQIAEDPMDSYLDTLGLWKKRIARDGSCLFRAVAEQIYPCQLHHERVRQECVRYMADHKDDFSKYLTTISYEDYLEAMKNTLEYAGQLEIAAMSKLYNRDFIIYQHPDQPGVDVTQNGYEKKIYLCYSYNNHFDAIFTKAHRDNLALIQSFVYEILYDKVFGSGEQVSVARRLLRKSDTIYPKEYMRGSEDGEYDDEEVDSDEREIHSSDDIDSERDNLESLDYEVCETGQNSILMTSTTSEANVSTSEVDTTEQSLDTADTTDQNNNDTSIGAVSKLYKNNDSVFPMSSSSCSLSDKSAIQKMPLPYKVAKSLDPVIYRNTAFDAWQAAKKEYEELVNQKAIAILQAGDKCLVKLNNNFSEKWNLAFVHNIQQDIANVFVVELNENHCVGIENLKPYKSGGGDGQMMHHGNNGFYHNGGSMFHVGGVQNVHKLVQSVNVQFSKIFINIDNKRRNVKKKQQFNSMKKSSSFHAFSTELPTLIEVEEQLGEHPFHYHDQHYGYLNNPHNQPMYHHLPHHQQQHHHSLPPPIAYQPQPQNGPGNHMANQFAYGHNINGSYTSLPHTQFNDSNDPNSKAKLSNSLSANNLNQYSSMPSNIQGPVNGNNNLNSSSSNLNTTNKNRRQRYPQNNNNNNNNMNFPNHNFNGPFNNNNGMKPAQQQQQQPWANNNFQPSPMGNFNMHPHTGPSLLHPQMPNGPQHLANQQNFNGPLGPQPLGPNQPFMQPPPSLAQLHAPNGPMQPAFMHQGPPPPHPHMGPMGPMNHHTASSSAHGPRPNFFNPISSFMFGPPPQPNQNHMSNMNSSHHSDQHNNYYFPSANANNNNSTNPTGSNQNKNNQRLPNQRNDNNNKGDTNTKTSNNGSYQQVPQHTSQSNVTNLMSMPPPTTSISTTELNQQQQPLTNTSNYLLMPAPQNNHSTVSNANTNSSTSGTNVPSAGTTNTAATTSTTSGSSGGNSNSNMTRSHSYHAGVSQSYDISSSNSSNVYVDVYNNNNNGPSNGNNASNPNVPNILPGTVNPHSTLLMQANGHANGNSGAVGNNSGVENINNVYGSNNFHGGYDYQYTRFDNNGFVSSTQNSLIGEDDLSNNNAHNSSAERQNNLWNKSNKLPKNQNNFFNDMVYPENSTNLAVNGQNNSQYYTNCFVVNIDGPINFNATHSLLDDGSDLPISDVNTIRFFYNLGIEYYRLNLATPYSQQQAPNYYAPAAGTTQALGQTTNPGSSTTNSQNPGSINKSSTQSQQKSTQQSNKLKEANDNQVSSTVASVSNNNSSSSNQQQVVPQHNSNKPLIQHQYNTRRVVH